MARGGGSTAPRNKKKRSDAPNTTQNGPLASNGPAETPDTKQQFAEAKSNNKATKSRQKKVREKVYFGSRVADPDSIGSVDPDA
jgi:hypothetical protein